MHPQSFQDGAVQHKLMTENDRIAICAIHTAGATGSIPVPPTNL